MDNLEKLGLEKIKDLPQGLILCKNETDQKIVCKKARGDECIMAELVTKLSNEYNKRFKRLQLPIYLTIEKENNQISMPFYEGKNYYDIWTKGYLGGSFMGFELSNEMADIIQDFKKIKIQEVEDFLNKNGVEKFSFCFDLWMNQFEERFGFFVEKGWLSKDELNNAKNILNGGFINSEAIFSNGDFYPRNLILIDSKKVIVLDWQTWNEDYRANIIDYLENVIAFAFIHMWENELWQVNFIKKIRRHSRVDFKNLRKAILIKSFDQAFFFYGNGKSFNNEYLCKRELLLFKKFIDDQYIYFLEKNTRNNFLEMLFRKD